MKKIIAVLAALFLSVCAFAYDGTVYGGIDGSFARTAWIPEASDPAIARSIVEDAYQGTNLEITKFYLVTDEIADEEDQELKSDIEDYIDSEYGVKNKQGYSHLVIRGNFEDYTDGWIILSHYNSKEKFMHYIYYYCVEPSKEE